MAKHGCAAMYLFEWFGLWGLLLAASCMTLVCCNVLWSPSTLLLYVFDFCYGLWDPQGLYQLEVAEVERVRVARAELARVKAAEAAARK